MFLLIPDDKDVRDRTLAALLTLLTLPASEKRYTYIIKLHFTIHFKKLK
jgi:hypothetical protein